MANRLRWEEVKSLAASWDNAVVESFFAGLKTELVAEARGETRHEAKTSDDEYIADALYSPRSGLSTWNHPSRKKTR